MIIVSKSRRWNGGSLRDEGENDARRLLLFELKRSGPLPSHLLSIDREETFRYHLRRCLKEKKMSLKQLIHREIKKIGPLTSIGETAKMMRHHKIGSLFVEENGQFTGIVTESDLVRKVITKDVSFEIPACTVLNAPLIEIDIEKSVMEANHLMHRNGVRHLAISEKGKIAGMISVRDLVRHFSSDRESPLHKMGD